MHEDKQTAEKAWRASDGKAFWYVAKYRYP